MKVVVVTPVPTPYRDPFWQVFSNEQMIDLSVVYCSAGRTDRPWSSLESSGYEKFFPRTQNLAKWRGWGASCYWTPRLSSVLAALQPDVCLVGGYNHVTMLQSVAYCRKNNIPWVLMSESWRERSGWAGRLKRRWLRCLLGSAAAALPTGTLATAALARLGMASDQMLQLPNVPDIAALRELSKNTAPYRDQLRQKVNVAPERRLVCFAARMIPKKRPLAVIEAFHQVSLSYNCQLVMIGSGPLLREAQSLSKRLSISDRVIFTGFLNADQVHQWMVLSDVFVQPSTETWGVAPIEALACGCQIVLSQQTGCHADIVRSTQDGIVLRDVAPAQIAGAIGKLLNQLNKPLCDNRPINTWLEANAYETLAGRLLKFLMTLSAAAKI